MKKSVTMRQTSLAQTRRRRIIFVIFLMVLSCAVFFIYKNKQKSPSSVHLSARIEEVKLWVAEWKNHVQKRLVHNKLQQNEKAKSWAENKNDAEPQIHFEFYNALPNMQVKTPEPITVSPAKSKAPPAQAAFTNEPVIHVNELEQALSEQINQHAYIVQLGIFYHVAAAEQYRQSLTAAGFDASVAKTIVAKKQIYRVQLGPFTDKTQAKLAKRQLQKKGINGIIKNG